MKMIKLVIGGLVMLSLSAGDVYAGTVDLAMHLIAKHENFYRNAHPDPCGNMEIGYGFSDPKLVAKGTMTMQEADKILHDRAVELIKYVHKDCGSQRLTPKQEAALVSLIYNIGQGRWQKSKLRQCVRSGADTKQIIKELKEFRCGRDKKTGKLVVLPGLEKRRADEAEFWLAKK